MDARRIKDIMTGLGWEYGTHRLCDLSGGDVRPRKGFARGPDSERKVELKAERTDGRVVKIVPVGGSRDDPPF